VLCRKSTITRDLAGSEPPATFEPRLSALPLQFFAPAAPAAPASAAPPVPCPPEPADPAAPPLPPAPAALTEPALPAAPLAPAPPAAVPAALMPAPPDMPPEPANIPPMPPELDGAPPIPLVPPLPATTPGTPAPAPALPGDPPAPLPVPPTPPARPAVAPVPFGVGGASSPPQPNTSVQAKIPSQSPRCSRRRFAVTFMDDPASRWRSEKPRELESRDSVRVHHKPFSSQLFCPRRSAGRPPVTGGAMPP
jgi:hypothetical protein